MVYSLMVCAWWLRLVDLEGAKENAYLNKSGKTCKLEDDN